MKTWFLTVFLISIFCIFLPLFIFAIHKPSNPPVSSYETATSTQEPKGEMQGQMEERKEEMQEQIEEKREDITKKIPTGEFIFPKEEEIIRNTVQIQFKIEGVLGVEFYLRRPEALVETYLGSGSPKENKIWAFEWDSRKTPNGRYFLIPQITSEYGNYEGVVILIEVNNEVEKKEEVIEEITRNVEKQHKKIQEAEERVEEETERVVEEVGEQIEQVSKKVEEVAEETVEDYKKEKVKSEIEEKKKEVREKMEEKIKKAVEAKDEKERKQVKEEIKKVVEEISKPVIEQAKPEKKQKVVTVSSELQKGVEKALEKVDKIAETRKLVEAQKEELFLKDTDKDNIPDFEELRLGTDPLNPDTDNDGFLDGSEIKLGFDPTKPSPADKIKFQEPEKTKAKISGNLKIEKIEVTSKEEKKVLVIRGKALPNAFVTVYIYSLPIIVITKADTNGNWEYVLDKPLFDGQHKIYVATTNNRGEIEEVSEPFVFAKTGNKIIRLLEPAKEKELSPAKMLQRSFTVLILGIVFFALGLAFTIIGLLLKSKKFPK